MKPATLRRALALLLSLALFLSALPMTALAAELDPDELTEQTAQLPEETAEVPDDADPASGEAAVQDADTEEALFTVDVQEDAAVQDVVSEEALFTADDPGEAASQQALGEGGGAEIGDSDPPPLFTSTADALAHIRKQLLARNPSFSVEVPNAVSAELHDGDWELLLEETDNPEGGDYLRAALGASRVETSTVTGSEKTVRTYSITYNDDPQLAAQASNLADQIVADQIRPSLQGTSRLEKLRKIYEFLTKNVTYASNSPALNKNPRPNDPVFTGAGALVNKEAVCQGFPAAAYILARRLGIPVRMIFSQEMDHAWFTAQLDNGKWYLFDPTWDAGKDPSKWNYFCRGKYDFTGHENSDDNFHDPAFREEHPLDDRDPDFDESVGYGEAPCFTMVTKDDCITTTLSENGRAKLLVFLHPDPNDPNGRKLLQRLNGANLPGVDVLLMGFAQAHDDQVAFLNQVGAGFPTDNMPKGCLYSACANVEPALKALCSLTGIDTTNKNGGNTYTFPTVFLINPNNRVVFAGCGLPGYMEDFLASYANAANSEPALHRIEGAHAVGLCGDNVYWHIYNGSMRISGFGPMWDNTACPTSIGWLSERPEDTIASSFSHVEIPAESIRNVTVDGGITGVGENMFIDCSALERITFLGNAPEMNGVYIAQNTVVYFPDDNATWNGVINHAAFPNCDWRISIASATVTAGDLTWNGQAQAVKVQFTVNGKLLPESDYTVTPATVTNVGTHDFTVRGKGIYADSIATGKVTVNPGSIQNGSLSIPTLTYNGAGQAVKVTVLLNGQVLPESSYTVTPATVTNAGSYDVTVTGNGNFTGTLTGKLTVKKANQNFTLPNSLAMYIGNALTLKAPGSKGTVSFQSSNTKIATVNAKGVITPKAPGKTTLTVTVAGNQNYNAVSKKLTITVKKYDTPKVTKVENVQGGVKLTLKLTKGAAKHRILYKTGKGKWTKLGDTTASTYTWKKAKNGTKYSFTVRCITADGKLYTSDQDNTGKSITYVASPTLTGVKNSTARTATAAWRKLSGVSGFEIQYSTSKTFKSGNKTVTVKKAAATSQAITGLSKNKTYYFRIRSFKTVSGKPVYSAWSAAKARKITK